MTKSTRYLSWTVFLSLTLLLLTLLYVANVNNDKVRGTNSYSLDVSKILQEEKGDKQLMKKARYEYFFRLLRNPITNSIPENIRRLELDHARTLPKRMEGGFGSYSTSQKGFNSATSHYSWNNVGPTDVGGRTRALGIDSRNPNVIIAGGASGGMWKSIDGGNSWQMKSDLNQNMSVTDVIQDPLNPDTWYYASGEFSGNSASDRGFRAPYFGTGIFKSTDNGETWSRLAVTEDNDTSYNSRFDLVSRIIINPVTGSLFIASNGFGIYKSTDGGTSFSTTPVLGAESGQLYSTIEAAADGTLYAALSQDNFGNTSYTPGIYFSTDDGESWNNITPETFPNTHQRTVLSIAPSDNKVFYSYTQKGAGDNTNQGISFHKFTLNSAGDDTASTEDRSANLPDFGNPVGGINTQGGYNMILAVKPDNPDFVLLGATNLFRSEDGFATPPAGNTPTEKDKFWIGGYANVNNVSQYENQHPDQHALVFDPTDPNRLWAGHDGALSVTDDVTATSVTWIDRDEGYITSQFYTVAAPEDSASGLIIGGTQDNGTPFFNVDDQDVQSTGTVDASSGDGSYAAFSRNDSLMFTSSQLGRVIRFDLMNDTYTGTALVHPIDAENELFIHPYAVDGTTMYYPDVSSSTGQPRMWVNTTIDEVTNTNGNGTTQGWTDIELSDIPSGSGYLVSTLEVSRNPADILFYGASSNSGSPRIYKAEQASSAFDVTDISISGAASGAYVHDIAVNPVDANELVAVFSNYGIAGIYHTSDGGSTWTEIEGNLEGDNTTPGPSIRSAAIIPTGGTTHYVVGTSTGLYSTETLNGTGTTWMQESSTSIGNSVVEYLHTRFSDAALFAGTHGRGVFKGRFQGVLTSPGPPASPAGLQISATETEVALSWDAGSERDIAGYNIYKGEQPRSLTLVGSSAGTSFTDPDTELRPTYYAISAVDAEDNESALTRPLSAFRTSRAIDSNWQLVGSPMLSSNQVSIPEDAQLVTFNGVYEVANDLEQVKGYWIKNSEPDEISYLGAAPTQASIPLSEGWNLISGVSDTVLAANIIDNGGILGATPVKRFAAGSYEDATQINPGEGYFVFAQQGGSITLRVDTSAAASTKIPVPTDTERISQTFDKLIFNSRGKSQTLYVSNTPVSNTQRQYYRMPPMAPGEVLDVRTDKGYQVIDQTGTGIKISSPAYPVQVSLQSVRPEEEGNGYRLVATSKNEKVFLDIAPGKPAVLEKAYDRLELEGLSGQEIPLKNALFPNYPNPFNPTTTVRYQISERSQVTLELYNVIGRKVSTIVSQTQPAGIYTVSINGANLSSGTYFLRIKAGDFSQIQKMALIK